MPETQKIVHENAETKKEGANKVRPSFPPPQRVPWLVFFSHGRQLKLNTFVSLSEERVYGRKLKEMHRTYYYASYDGWLFMTDFSREACFLLNMFSMKKVMLPPPPGGVSSFDSAVITSSSLDEGCNRILLYQRDENAFLFQSHQKDKWETVKCNCRYRIQVLLKCNGQIYALTEQSRLAIVHVAPFPRVKLLRARVPIQFDMTETIFILESCGGLYVVKMLSHCLSERTYSFEVFKMDFSEKKWVEVSSLGNRAFFVGTSGPGESCSAPTTGIEANCIYFFSPNSGCVFKFDMTDKSLHTEFSCSSIPQPWDDVAWIKSLRS